MTSDSRLAAVARSQMGLFTRRQAYEAGFSRSTGWRRIEQGVWTPHHTRVLTLRAAGRLDADQELLAAVMQAGAVAVVSHRGAAYLYGILSSPEIPEITIGRRSKRLPGVRVHTTEDMPKEDTTVVRGIPTTSIERTALDMLAVLEGDAAAAFLDCCLRDRRCSARRLRRRARALNSPSRSGCAKALGLLEESHPEVTKNA